MAAEATVRQTLNVTYSKTSSGTTYTGQPKIDVSKTYTTDDITKVFTASATIASPATHDLTSCTDSFGTALTFSSLKGLFIRNMSASATLVVGGGSDAVLDTDQYTVGPESSIFVTTTFNVDANEKIITLTPSASLAYQLIAVGV